MTVLMPERICSNCHVSTTTSDFTSLERSITAVMLPTDEYCIFCGEKLLKQERPPSLAIIYATTALSRSKCLKCGHNESKWGREPPLQIGQYCPKCGAKFDSASLENFVGHEV